MRYVSLKRLAEVQRQHRREGRFARQAREIQVGHLAAQAGLFVWDDATLAQLFALLRRLYDCPNPVAVLDSLVSTE